MYGVPRMAEERRNSLTEVFQLTKTHQPIFSLSAPVFILIHHFTFPAQLTIAHRPVRCFEQVVVTGVCPFPHPPVSALSFFPRTKVLSNSS